MTATLFVLPTPVHIPAAKTVKSKPKPKGYTAEFEQLWGPYPRKLNCSKFDAFKAWQKLSDEEQQQAIAAVPVYALSMRGKDEQYLPHCATWLNGKRFETVAIAPRAAVPPVVVTGNWTEILKIYKATGRWNRDLGPEPGCTGCTVPAGALCAAGL